MSMSNDQIIAQNALTNQKHLTSMYNTAAGECANNQLRCAMMDLLKDEHEIQNDLFVDMNSRGWYPVKQAQAQDVDMVKQTLNQNK